MKTERLDVTPRGIDRAAEILSSGGIVAIPTETVYGLAADATDEAALHRVFAAKGRPQDNPLIVHIAEIDTLKVLAREIPSAAFRLAERFWPGPLTMVLKRTDATAKTVSAGLDTVAIRMPDHPVAQAVIRAGVPLAAPSANTSGSPSPTTAHHVLHDLDGKIDGVLMGDECAVGVESTVVDLSSTPPRLLRPGGVSAEELREILPDLVLDKAILVEPEQGAKVASPGMKYKHYAPKTTSFLVEGTSAQFVDYVNQKKNGAALCFSEEAALLTVPHLCYGSAQDESELAHNLFSALREVDGLGAKEIYIHAPEKSGVGLAVYNRLIRAAAFQVIAL